MGGGGGAGKSTTTTSAELAPELRPLFKESGERVLELQRGLPISGSEFMQPRPLQVAPLSQTQQLGLSKIPDITATPGTENLALSNILNLPSLAGRRPTGANMETSPVIQAARDVFRRSVEPGIVNQLTLSGLGRSTAVPDAIAKAEGSFILPMIQDELGREERALARESEAFGQGIPQLMALGQTESGRRLAQIDATLKGGEVERGVAQDTNLAALNDYLRRQGLAEQALFGPFGQLLPSGIAQSQVSKTSTKGGK